MNHGLLISIIIPTQFESYRISSLKEAIIVASNEVCSIGEIVIALDNPQKHTECKRLISDINNSIKIVTSDVKLGKSSICNLAAKSCNGLYISILDDDDLLKEGFGEITKKIITEMDLDVFYYAADEQLIFKNGKIIYSKHRYGEPFDVIKLLHMNYIAQASIVISKRAFFSVNGFDSDLVVLEDWDLFRRLSFYYKFKFIDKSTVIYRKSFKNITRSTYLGEETNKWHMAMKRILSKNLENDRIIPIAIIEVNNSKSFENYEEFFCGIRIPHFIATEVNKTNIDSNEIKLIPLGKSSKYLFKNSKKYVFKSIQMGETNSMDLLLSLYQQFQKQLLL